MATAVEVIPFYSNWSFWAVFVSVIAIALSQMPPVYLWFRRAKLDLEPYSRIHITHRVGNPNIHLHLILSNIGGREVKIKSITIKLKREGSDICNLSAQNYWQNPSDTNTILLTTFSLKPKQEWSHIVHFVKHFTRENEKRYRDAESKLRENILEKKRNSVNSEALVEATGDLVEPFISMFNENFIWNAAEYTISISVVTSNERANISRDYRFTLFESESAELIKIKEDYKYGDGISWDSGKHTGIGIQIRET